MKPTGDHAFPLEGHDLPSADIATAAYHLADAMIPARWTEAKGEQNDNTQNVRKT